MSDRDRYEELRRGPWTATTQVKMNKLKKRMRSN